MDSSRAAEFHPEDFLGRRLEDALRTARELGLPIPAIAETCDPRRQREGGIVRVVRVQGGNWIVARFFEDAAPDGGEQNGSGEESREESNEAE